MSTKAATFIRSIFGILLCDKSVANVPNQIGCWKLNTYNFPQIPGIINKYKIREIHDSFIANFKNVI